jgi:hypothetical protein
MFPLTVKTSLLSPSAGTIKRFSKATLVVSAVSVKLEICTFTLPRKVFDLECPFVNPTKLVRDLVTVRFSIYSPAFILTATRLSGSIFATA